MNGIISDPKKIPPSLDEVREFLASLNSRTDAEQFVLFYQERGWKAGRVPMKDWQAAARRWHLNGWGANNAARVHTQHSMTEWERKQKAERLRELLERLRDITNPGGSAYSVQLDERKQKMADELRAQITALKKELGHVSDTGA